VHVKRPCLTRYSFRRAPAQGDERDAAAPIPAGANVGMSGFTSAGYPKAVPGTLDDRITAARKDGHPFSVWTGAATTPELDGAPAAVDKDGPGDDPR
jgi:acyl-CoA hydrolase